MIRTQLIGLVSVLALGLMLSGCARLQSEMRHGWMATFGPAPNVAKPASHRHKTRVIRRAARPAPKTAIRAIDPDLVTGSVTPVAAPVAPESVLQACKRRLYLETATSTEEIRAAEAACKALIVNQPYGAGAQ